MKESILELEKAIGEVMDKASAEGLDYFDMRFEICPAEVIYGFGAYGMPTRFAHWSFGKGYSRIKTEYDLNLSRIYEMVINTDPCYAFLLDRNTLIQNKLIVGHALAHSDFFKNNAFFRSTSRRMLDTMEASARRIQDYELSYEQKTVESFIDAVLSIQEHVNPYDRLSESVHSSGKGSRQETKDVLGYLKAHSPILDDWQRDIVNIIREETLYFWPQLETKILNEGWATFWHLRLLRRMELSEAETLELAVMQSELITPGRFRINPYHLGLRILESIEAHFGTEELWDVRARENDVSLIRNYLTPELVDELDLYLYRRVGYEWRVVDKNWHRIRDTLVQSLINGGHPYIVVMDGDFKGLGELYLRHAYEGVELDVPYLERTLPHIHKLWSRTVHLETVLDEKTVQFSYDGERIARSFL
ncbi:MAG: SpoVR family protein [Eubacteriales bacterium]|nr:SpoVR family protein [Bacillota bacterium]MBU4597880.1 SpoVR family protein [Pseudomonadota bacterium]MBV1728324.1 SpoVR family protein [Desulforudis sp.]MDP3050481.1 SpoVR family protein [Eubacteriales bacterium]MDQ7789626.1 SpoVR family protein [Clostridia bacterium]